MNRKLAAQLIDNYSFNSCIALLAACAPDILDDLQKSLCTVLDPAQALAMARDALHKAYRREKLAN